MIKKLLLLLVLAFPLGELARWSLGSSTNLLLNDAMVAVVVVYGLYFYRQKLQLLTHDPLFRPIIVVFGTMVLSLIINIPRLTSGQLLISTLYPLRWAVYAGLYFFGINLVGKDKTWLRQGLILAAVVVAVAGILQYIFIPDVSWLAQFDWDSHYFRLISTMLDPNFTGIILVLGLVLTYLSLRGVHRQADDKAIPYHMRLPRPAVAGLAMTVIYLALVLTYSRASYLAYLVAFGAVAFYKRSVKIFLIAALVLVVTIPLLPKSTGIGTNLSREDSITARLNNWRQSIEIWNRAPIFGVGFDAYRYSQNTTEQSHSGAGADSTLLLILATTGVVGLLAYLYLLTSMWRGGRGDMLILASLAAIFIHSWFDNTLLFPFVMEWLWLVLATRQTTS